MSARVRDRFHATGVVLATLLWHAGAAPGDGVAAQAPASPASVPSKPGDKVISAADCTVERLGTSVPPSAIGEPVRSVTLSTPAWIDASNGAAAH